MAWLRGGSWLGAVVLGGCFADDNLSARHDGRDLETVGEVAVDSDAAVDSDVAVDSGEADGARDVALDGAVDSDGGFESDDGAVDSAVDGAVDSDGSFGSDGVAVDSADAHDGAVDSGDSFDTHDDGAVDSDDSLDAHDGAVDSGEPGFRCGRDLFLSEYLEGTGWEKALEIANHTGLDVELDGYALWKITNGGDWAEGAAHDFPLTGRLADGEVLVLCHASAPGPILAVCDVPSASDVLEFNGDDALALVHDGAIIDVVGDAGDDPGVGWTIGEVAAATADHSLRRAADRVDGTAEWAPETWQVFANGASEDLGRSVVDGTCPHRVEPAAVINEVGAQTGGADFIEIAVADATRPGGQLDVGGWVLASTSGRYVFPAATTVPANGFLALSQGVLGFGLGLVDRVWLYDADGQLQDLVGWDGDDLARGASYGRLPDVSGALTACSVATPGAPNRNPDTWCGDGICQDGDGGERCTECPGDCPLCRPEVGDLVIAEVLPEPAGGPEWVELVNLAGGPLDLAGLVLRDGRDDVWAVPPGQILDAAGRLVLGSAAAGYVDVVYTGISLAAADALAIERGALVLDRVAWGDVARGVSTSLSEDHLDPLGNDDAAVWCDASDAFADGLGTPGLANETCAICGDAACDARESCETCAADCGACPVPGCADDLFFSEYVEGFTFDKAIEIANVTGAPVDLSRYEVWRITNGGDTWDDIPASARVPLTGTLASGDVWVGCNVRAVAAILAHCDATYSQGAAPTSFNGDDALALVRDGLIIDVIGDDAGDPGTGWEVAGVPNATQDHDLVRRPEVRHGNVDWAASALTEWQVRAPDQATLGNHEVSYICAP